jgi:mannosyltransferase OCH1-like enzyme
MITYNKETPILLVACGSLETTKRIFIELQRIEPQRLYLSFNIFDNEEQASAQKEIMSIVSNIKWECKVKVLSKEIPLVNTSLTKYYYRSIFNPSMLKAICWFFRKETEGIVLDGFSVPYPAFFAFCSCLLEKYRYDERIGHISGWDFRKSNRKLATNDSYYYSKLVNISYGWASWRRVWQDINIQSKTFRAFKKLNIIEEIPSHNPFLYQWHYLNHLNTHWESRCEYANLINNRLSIVQDTGQIPVNEYEFADMKHPDFMVNQFTEDLRLQEQKYNIPVITANKPDSITFLQEKLSSFSTEAAKQMKIPRVIHQIYEDPAGPSANELRMAQSWKEKMPNWEYRFWDRQMIHDFLEFQCPDFLACYHSYPFNVQRWDAIRYLILYHIGGLYVDMDYECIEPLDVLLSGSTCCMGMEPTINSRVHNKPLIVGNALMASKPGHPYMAAVIEDMKSNFFVNYGKGDSIQVMESTGPFLVTRVYEQFKKKKEVTLLPADLVTPLSMKEVWLLQAGGVTKELEGKVEKAFAVHYFFGSWTSQTAENNK